MMILLPWPLVIDAGVPSKFDEFVMSDLAFRLLELSAIEVDLLLKLIDGMKDITKEEANGLSYSKNIIEAVRRARKGFMAQTLAQQCVDFLILNLIFFSINTAFAGNRV